MDDFLKKIKSEYIQSFLHIPNTMARIFSQDSLKQLKQSEEKVGDREEKKDLIIETVDSIFSSSEDDQSKIERIHKNISRKKVAIDLCTGEDAEKFLSHRVDRDVFDLEYHKNFKYNLQFNYTNLNQKLPLKGNDWTNFLRYSDEMNQVLNFLGGLGIKFEGQIDFIIPNIESRHISDVLTNEAKKYFVFGDKSLFTDKTYEIFGEVTINLFSPSIYIHKLRQLIRYIVLIKLIEKYPEQFNDLFPQRNKKVIMIVTDGKYSEFINKISESKIFSNDFEEKEYISNSIDKIINCKKFKEEIDYFNNKIDSMGNNKSKIYKDIKNINSPEQLKEKQKDYETFKEDYNTDINSLKSRTVNLLRILKSSEIPFILCYFPKIGAEFPYDLFAGIPIALQKVKTKDNFYQYQFSLFDKNKYVSQTELSEKYLSKDEIKKNYLSLEESRKMKEELKQAIEELADIKEILFKEKPELRQIFEERKRLKQKK